MAGAAITLCHGGQTIATTSSGKDGAFSFPDVPAGVYIVVASAASLEEAHPLRVSLGPGLHVVRVELQHLCIGDHPFSRLPTTPRTIRCSSDEPAKEASRRPVSAVLALPFGELEICFRNLDINGSGILGAQCLGKIGLRGHHFDRAAETGLISFRRETHG